MVWCETALGATFPDVLSISRSYPHAKAHDVRIYEVKVSRADFRADVTTGKYRKYLQYAHRVLFAVPSGMVSADEIPADAGLLEYDERGPAWRTVKLGPKSRTRFEWPIHAWFALLLSGVECGPSTRNLHDRLMELDARRHRHLRANGYQVLRGWLADAQEAAGLPPTSDYNALAYEVRRLRRERDSLLAELGRPTGQRSDMISIKDALARLPDVAERIYSENIDGGWASSDFLYGCALFGLLELYPRAFVDDRPIAQEGDDEAA